MGALVGTSVAGSVGSLLPPQAAKQAITIIRDNTRANNFFIMFTILSFSAFAGRRLGLFFSIWGAVLFDGLIIL